MKNTEPMENNEFFNTEAFSKDLLTKRCVDRRMTIREAASEIGISPATLSRLENKHLPKPESWYLCSKWLERDMLHYIRKDNDGK